MNIQDIKRTDILFFMQLSAATFSTAVSLITLRRIFSEKGWLSRLTVRPELQKYYYLGIILVVLLAIGVFIYFRVSNEQLKANAKKEQQEEMLLPTGVGGTF